MKAICGRSGLYFEYIGKMLRLLFVPGCDIERLRTRLLTDLKLLPSMKNLIDKSELISKLQNLEGPPTAPIKAWPDRGRRERDRAQTLNE